jgi:hypothetical protein
MHAQRTTYHLPAGDLSALISATREVLTPAWVQASAALKARDATRLLDVAAVEGQPGPRNALAQVMAATTVTAGPVRANLRMTIARDLPAGWFAVAIDTAHQSMRAAFETLPGVAPRAGVGRLDRPFPTWAHTAPPVAPGLICAQHMPTRAVRARTLAHHLVTNALLWAVPQARTDQDQVLAAAADTGRYPQLVDLAGDLLPDITFEHLTGLLPAPAPDLTAAHRRFAAAVNLTARTLAAVPRSLATRPILDPAQILR